MGAHQPPNRRQGVIDLIRTRLGRRSVDLPPVAFKTPPCSEPRRVVSDAPRHLYLPDSVGSGLFRLGGGFWRAAAAAAVTTSRRGGCVGRPVGRTRG